jgi:hypothetical protein
MTEGSSCGEVWRSVTDAPPVDAAAEVAAAAALVTAAAELVTAAAELVTAELAVPLAAAPPLPALLDLPRFPALKLLLPGFPLWGRGAATTEQIRAPKKKIEVAFMLRENVDRNERIKR